MKIIGFAIRHFLPLGAVAVLGTMLFSSASSTEFARVDGFGVEMDALPPVTLENVDLLFSLIKSSGAGYIRQEINWSKVEISPDVYDWSAVEPLDLIVSSAASQEIQIVAVLTGGPVYLAAPGQTVDRTALGERWERFIQAAVDHFGETINIWEVGSDVNSAWGMSQFLLPHSPGDPLGPDPQYYAKLLRSASKIIKDADPNDLVWMGTLTGVAANGCAMNPLTFILEINAAKGWKSIDAIVYDPEQGASAPEYQAEGSVNSACTSSLMSVPTSMSTEVQSVQELARQLGGKTVVISGLGWKNADLERLGSGRSISLGQLEADLLVRASAALMGLNSIPTIIWDADIMNTDSALNAMTNMAETLESSKPLGRLQGDGSVFEYRFRHGGQITAIAWRAQDGDAPYPVNLEAGDLRSMTAFPADAPDLNRENGLEIEAGPEGVFTIMLNERPVLFTGKSGDLLENLKQSIQDQSEIWQMELKDAFQRWVNEQKASFKDMLEEWFDQLKESAVEWGEEQLDELLP